MVTSRALKQQVKFLAAHSCLSTLAFAAMDFIVLI
jgi:hypothetical protein